MSWHASRLGDVLTLKRGHDLPDSQRQDGDVPVVSSSGITGYHSEPKAKAPGVVTGRYGTLGEVFYLEEDYWPLNTALYVADFKCNHPRFVAYFLEDVLRNYQSDKAAVPGVNRNVLHELKVRCPDTTIQERIAGILVAYDDLIGNNRRRMELMEEGARQLYLEWFVRLRFPGHEHTRITNGVPEGWERKPLEQLNGFLSRGIAPHYDDEAEGLVINQKCIRGGRLDLSLARHQSREFRSERQVQHGDVLVNSTGEGTLGRVAQVLARIDRCTVDTHVTMVRPAPGIGIHYFGQALMAWEPRFSTMGRGATNQTELSRGQIAGVHILVPPRSLVQQFEDVAAPAFRQVWVLMEQNEKLGAARDLLLPRLMRGEIAV
jgi:type I restriction enzyme S subunit